ncbi:MAG TPA: hypothetical protein VGD74_02690 [Vulgatibacter sp.]
MSATHSPAAPRPLRWIKFAAGIAAGAVTLGAVAPACRAALAIVSQPYAAAESPWRLLPSVAAGAFVLWAWIRLVSDASFDRRAPKGLVAALAGVAIAASASHGASIRTTGRPAGEAIASSLLAARSIAAGGLFSGEGAAALRLLLMSRGAPPPYVDRFFRQVPRTVVVLEGRDAPVLAPRPGDPPGTLYLALSHTGDAGWLTASALDGDRISIVRDAGHPLVLGVVACDPDGTGGAAC